LLLNVTRHPYSFRGDSTSYDAGPEGSEETWHEDLLNYVGGDPKDRDRIEEAMRALGRRAGIELDYGVRTNWQPIDSQRLMLWARRFGKAEPYMSSIARRHFEERQSASHGATLLAAAAEAGLDVEAARIFLEGDELREEVWKSYGDTIQTKGIHSIPFFVFNSPLTSGGPFRNGTGKPVIVKGSADELHFVEVFEQLLRNVEHEGAL